MNCEVVLAWHIFQCQPIDTNHQESKDKCHSTNCKIQVTRRSKNMWGMECGQFGKIHKHLTVQCQALLTMKYAEWKPKSVCVLL
jgi:hypothetical protein